MAPPSKPCAYPGCWRLAVRRARCAQHAAPAGFTRRVTPKRTYGAEHRSLREQTLARDGYRCVRCGATTGLTRDHVDRLGPETLANSQTLCGGCNARKAQAEARVARMNRVAR